MLDDRPANPLATTTDLVLAHPTATVLPRLHRRIGGSGLTCRRDAGT